jgi:tripartite-type tricarboxylate transporter receptor subunit TctC
LTHLSGELFRMMTGIEVVHVPYRGTPAAGLMAGDVHAMFDAIGSAVPHIQSGALRALGVTGTARLRVLPDVPLISDAVPGYAVTGWLGIGVPKGTPPEIVERLNREVNAALADPPVKARMDDLGSDPLPGSAVDFGKLIVENREVEQSDPSGQYQGRLIVDRQCPAGGNLRPVTALITAPLCGR